MGSYHQIRGHYEAMSPEELAEAVIDLAMFQERAMVKSSYHERQMKEDAVTIAQLRRDLHVEKVGHKESMAWLQSKVSKQAAEIRRLTDQKEK